MVTNTRIAKDLIEAKSDRGPSSPRSNYTKPRASGPKLQGREGL